ncbi:unnamed protein product [Moneuplotes crassus]|uniref:PX domain-containing protein n=1 Tax=Euplotes crassus TaxID=5936 RepID=A0AAD1U5Y4_EUPCR|nr:unnamed protein product [Moneuplotes crassus]
MEVTDQDFERSEREKKQLFLQDEIVKKRYDKAKFAVYMNECKENGTDIDLWTFDELYDAVVAFQQSQDNPVVKESESSSEEDVLYEYIHPAEREKMKERRIKERMSIHPEEAKIEESPDMKTNKPNNLDCNQTQEFECSMDDQACKDDHTESKEKESNEREIQFLKNISYESEENNVGLHSQENPEYGEQEQIKNRSPEISKDVKKALDDFFLNEENDFDNIQPEEVKDVPKLDNANTPKRGKTMRNQPLEEIIKEDLLPEMPEPVAVGFYIADIKTSDETKLLAEASVTANVLEATYCPGGIFQFAYNEYTIVTNPFGWMTKRRETDFVKLREYLCKMFPQYCIPPLVTPKSMYDASSLKKKEFFFQKFLNDVLANEELRACKYLELFLTVPNENKFKPIRKKHDRYPKPIELNEFCTIDGKVSINESRANPELIKNYSSKFIDRFQSIFKSLEEATEEIQKSSLQLNKSLRKFSECFKHLSKLYSVCGFEEFGKLYKHIKEVSNKYSEQVLEKALIFKTELSHEFTYHHFEADSYKELNKLRSDVEYTFKKMNNDLKAKKDRLWSSRSTKDFSKWDLSPEDSLVIDSILREESYAKAKMLPKETEQVHSKLNLLRYIENQCVKEIRRCGRVQWATIKEKFKRVEKCLNL